MTIRKLVVTALTTGIIQADGFIQSLGLPLQVGQYAHAGVELVFIGSASALIYEMGAWSWKRITTPRPRMEAEAQTAIAEKSQQLVRLRQLLAKLEAEAQMELAERSQQPAEAPAQPATPQSSTTSSSAAEPQSGFMKAVSKAAAEGGMN